MGRYLLLLAFFLIAALPFLPFFEQAEEDDLSAGDAEELLTIVSPHNREVKMEYTRSFCAWMQREHKRKVGIRWLDVGGTSKILKDLESRFATHPESPGVDILFGGGVDPFIRSKRQGWLVPADIPEPLLRGIPSRCAGMPVYDPQQYWFGVALSGFGIIYNRALIKRLKLTEPHGWDDLGRPEFRSWVGSGDPRSSGSVHMCYEIILQAYGFEKGWALVTRICANVRHFGEGGGTAPREVSSGEVVAGMVIDQYAQRTIAALEASYAIVDGHKPKDPPLGFALPEGATVINPDAIAILKGAPKPELARWFVRFSLSDEGQRILFQPPGRNGQRHGLHRMPVRESLFKDPEAPEVNPYEFKSGMEYDDSKGGRRWGVLNDLIGKWCVDAHEDLTAAWQAIIEAGAPADLVERLCAAPVTEKELFERGEDWKAARIRQKLLVEWAHKARTRYRALRDEAKLRSQ